MLDGYDAIADVYDRWSADMSDDIAFWVSEAKQVSSVLEVGVGTARVATAIAAAGLPIVGIDTSAAMLAQASQRRIDVAAVNPGVADRLELVEADMALFDLERTFPLVTLPFRVFNHALTVDDQVAVLANLRRHMTPGGRLVLTIPVPTQRDFEGTDALTHQGRFDGPDGTARVLWRSVAYIPASQRLTFHFVVDDLDAAGVVTQRSHGESTVRLVTPGEVDHALDRAGFEVADRWGWFDRRPYDDTSTEYIVAARRRETWRRA